jgi:2,4-diketo-3-deoxy-L-fuconate hydrolase
MRLARFDDSRIGLVEGERVYDVTPALASMPALRWPAPPGDQLIAELGNLKEAFQRVRTRAEPLPLPQLKLLSPVATPSKIVAAPANYRAHIEVDAADRGVDVANIQAQLLAMDRPVDQLGLFLKSATSLVGPGEGVIIDWPGPQRRCDHEVEVAIVIGRKARHVPRAAALDYVAGYAIGLDITIRGTEDRSFRKSADTFSVVGPWLATPEEMANPLDSDFWITVNGQTRQRSSTKAITVGFAELIELASSVYTLYPGDIIMTGTPEGVGPIAPGDVLQAGCAGIGEMTVHVAKR